jgi:hypothetical protein
MICVRHAHYVFNDVYTNLNNVSNFYKNNWVEVDQDSICFKHVVKIIVNDCFRPALYALSMLVSTVAVFVFCIIVAPFRMWSLPNIVNIWTQNEINSLGDKSIAIRERLEKYIIKKFPDLTDDVRNRYINYGIASYGQCLRSYAPIAVKWTHSLLKKANDGHKHLVFLARDGIASYQIAKRILANERYQKLYPNLSSESLTLAWFSRNVMKNSDKTLLKEYSEQIGVPKSKPLIFVDIGYNGSLIQPIQELFAGEEISFEYFISFTDNANGFVGTRNNTLPHFKDCWTSPVFWLEESCQGVALSSSELVKKGEEIYPITMIPGEEKTCIDEPINFIVRTANMWAIKDAACTDPENIDFITERNNLDRLFQELLEGRTPLLTKGEY